MQAIGCLSKHLGVYVGKSALTILRRDGEGSTEPKYLIPCFQEKHLEREIVPVPQTDTGR